MDLCGKETPVQRAPSVVVVGWDPVWSEILGARTSAYLDLFSWVEDWCIPETKVERALPLFILKYRLKRNSCNRLS